MLKHWIIFITIAIFILITIHSLKYWLKSKTKAKITPEMEKRANIKAVLYIFFYWLCDLFYMSWFIDSLACKYIFGGLIMLIVFVNLSKIVSFPNSKSIFQIIGMVQDFIIGVGLSIYLIYIIPNKELQNIVVPIASAVYGRIITLAGVSLGIKKLIKIEKKMRSKRQNLWFLLSDKASKYYTMPFIALDNFDFSHSVIIGFRINDSFHLYDTYQVLPKNILMFIYNNFTFSINEEKIDYVALLIKDLLDNIYELELKFNIENKGNENNIKIIGNFETEPTTLKLNAKEI